MTVRVWDFYGFQNQPEMSELGQHKEWVRDAAWCGLTNLGYSMIASCSEDGVCKVWKETKKGMWTSANIEFTVPLYKVSWSSGSSLLAVSGGED